MTDTNDNTIAPEDMDLARELASFDPVHDVPSPVRVGDKFRAPANIRATGLPPHLGGPILAALRDVHPNRRDSVEQEMVAKALNQNSYALRVKQGPGQGATEYQRVSLAIVREVHVLESEDLDIRARLAEVERWDTEYDELGKPRPIPVERIRGQERKALEYRLQQIDHHLAQLNGPEGERRRAKALKESVEEEKGRRQALADAAEVQRRAESLARETRINKAAEARARFMGPTSL